MNLCFLDRSTNLDTVDDLETRARGGMVSSLFQVTDYLARRGHDVTVLSDIKQYGRTSAGVNWVNDVSITEHFDWLICNRGIADGYPDIRAKKRALWTHDLPHAGFVPDRRTLKAIDRMVFMSRYAERLWRTFYPDIGRSVRIPNGVDRELFKPSEKDWDYLIYASAPNRGLKRLPLIFDALRQRLPDRHLKMRVYSNLEVLHPGEVRDDKQDGYALDYKALNEVGITRFDPVPQLQLARELGRAGLMILPTDYPEICGNIILQSLACSTPVVTTGGIGSAPEWIRHNYNGWFTQFQPVDYMVHSVEIIRGAEGILKDRNRHVAMSKAAEMTPLLSWADVGRRWNRFLTSRRWW